MRINNYDMKTLGEFKLKIRQSDVINTTTRQDKRGGDYKKDSHKDGGQA